MVCVPSRNVHIVLFMRRIIPYSYATRIAIECEWHSKILRQPPSIPLGIAILHLYRFDVDTQKGIFVHHQVLVDIDLRYAVALSVFFSFSSFYALWFRSCFLSYCWWVCDSATCCWVLVAGKVSYFTHIRETGNDIIISEISFHVWYTYTFINIFCAVQHSKRFW